MHRGLGWALEVVYNQHSPLSSTDMTCHKAMQLNSDKIMQVFLACNRLLMKPTKFNKDWHLELNADIRSVSQIGFELQLQEHCGIFRVSYTWLAVAPEVAVIVRLICEDIKFRDFEDELE